MRADLLPIVVLFALTSNLQRGAVTGVAVAPGAAEVGRRVAFTVTGKNPCGAVNIDYGDGNIVTHPVTHVPARIEYTYARAGTYRVRARGMGNCDGEAWTSVRALPLPSRPSPADSAGNMRFQGMDRNGDGIITRDEWRGSDQSFRVHDWNRDGVLSGNEVRSRGRWQSGGAEDDDFDPDRWYEFDDWTDARFANLDHNRDNRITRDEWHYDLEAFYRVDRNRDGVLSRAEFLADTPDDDREDRFRNLDVDRSGRIERDEWHGTRDAFDWLDRNNDGVLSHIEVVGENSVASDPFRSLDINNNGLISRDEWHWSRASFDQRDRNKDGVLSRQELSELTTFRTTRLVTSTERWTDSGVYVREGDVVKITGTGTLQLSNNPADRAGAGGAHSGRRAPDAPLKDQPAGALIARIGESAPMFVGSESTIRARSSGQLYLGVNDDYLMDNRGELRVTISLERQLLTGSK